MPTPEWKDKTHTIAVFNEDHEFIAAQAEAEHRSIIRQMQHWVGLLRRGKSIKSVRVPKSKKA